MFPLTPPSTIRKRKSERSNTFMEKRARLPFYEDLYSKQNPEEYREGRAELCESETDSEGDVEQGEKEMSHNRRNSVQRTRGSPGFMKQFAAPKEYSLVVDPGIKSHSEERPRQGEILLGFHVKFRTITNVTSLRLNFDVKGEH